MRIFLTGAHSTGKTTLATALSERLGLPLLQWRQNYSGRIPGAVSLV